jgi:hypothetical protein
MLEVPLWRSYLAGCILLGIAPCTAMVLVWGYLARGNDGHTLVMVAINSLTMLLLYGPLGGFLLGVGRLPVPWQALLLSISVYVALPLAAGYASRRWIVAAKGEEWFQEKFLHVLTPVTIGALLLTLVLLFSFKGEVILSNPLTILWPRPLAAPPLPGCRPVGPDRRVEPLRGRDRDVGHVVRAFVRGGPGHGRGVAHRGSRHADAGSHLPADAGVVSRGVSESRGQRFTRPLSPVYQACWRLLRCSAIQFSDSMGLKAIPT